MRLLLVLTLLVASGCAVTRDSPTAPVKPATTQLADAMSVIAAHEWLFDRQATLLAMMDADPASYAKMEQDHNEFYATFRNEKFTTRDIHTDYTRTTPFVVIRSTDTQVWIQFFQPDGSIAQCTRMELNGDRLKMMFGDGWLVFKRR
ncbi:MAG: hypothetical protein QM770_11235 [Tepidisphaeraceae bacterium]